VNEIAFLQHHNKQNKNCNQSDNFRVYSVAVYYSTLSALDMTLRETFATNLKRLRQQKCLSQEELAGLAEIDRTYVSLLERAQYSATLDVVQRIADAFGVEPIELLTLK
jgi:ribosome-binding protein aMBF1 (putative translation factor)